MQLPSKSPITLPFGATTAPYSPASPHEGTDFAYIPDDTIYAPFSGTVILMPNNGRDGNGLYMYNGDQFHGMLHSSKYLVNDKEHVQEGQPIAIMGDTGYAIGKHLHWCVKVNNQFIDPMSLIKENQMFPNEGDVWNIVKDLTGENATQEQIDVYTKKPFNVPDGIYYGYIQVEIARLKKEIADGGHGNVTPLAPGIYEVK